MAFCLPRPDTGGPDSRPDVYVSRFSPGTLGVAFPSGRAEGGAFVVIANNLDPSAERSFASVHATVAHELFHLVQFAYFRDPDPPIPTWILEGTAAALESRVNPDLEDLVATLQLRRWLSAPARGLTNQSYGAQLFWRYFDARVPAFLPELLTRLATPARRGGGGAHGHLDVCADEREAVRAGLPPLRALGRRSSTPTRSCRPPSFAAGLDHRAGTAPLSIHYLRLALPRTTGRSLTIRFPRGAAGASATLTYELENDVAGEPAHSGRLVPRVTDRGRTRTLVVPAALLRNPRLANPLLVISNGGPRRVAYAVSAR